MLAVAPGFKSVNLKTGASTPRTASSKIANLPLRPFRVRLLTQRKGSLSTSAELENRSANKSVGSAACEPEAVPSIFAEN